MADQMLKSAVSSSEAKSVRSAKKPRQMQEVENDSGVRVIGQCLTPVDTLGLDFSADSQILVDDIVGVPRNGDRFDYGSVVSVKKDTITCLLSHDPLLKKELPPILCGVLWPLKSPPRDRLDRINSLERASRDLHLYLTTVGDPSLLTPPVRSMISFVQNHVAICLAILARNVCSGHPIDATTDAHSRPGHAYKPSSGGPSDQDGRGGRGLHETGFASDTVTSELLRDIVDAERQTSQLQTEAFIKLSMAQEKKWKMVSHLVERHIR